MPLSFEANRGQTDPAVNFLSRGSGYTLFLTPTEAELSLQAPGGHDAASPANSPAPAENVLRMSVVGANPAAHVVGLDAQTTKTNYLIGRDPSQWRTNISNFGKVEYQGIYPGIDLVYYGNQRQLEYDFTVAQGADPGIIMLAFAGAESLTLTPHGDLDVHTAGGDLVEHAPVLYQQAGEIRQAVSGRYVLRGQNRVGFQVEAYDAMRPLVIDPVLSYSTYLGASDAETYAGGIAVDAAGNAYVNGASFGVGFPTTQGAVQPSFGGGNYDAFIAKLNPTGTGLIYATYLGGSELDQGYAIAVDASGDAYVTGETASSDFPVTAGALQKSLHGEASLFVAKLNPMGSALLYATYLGGFEEYGQAAICVDGSGNAYVTGGTQSSAFPTTPGAVQPTFGSGKGHAFVSKLNPTGTALVYSTFLGGSGGEGASGIACDGSGNAYVVGSTGSKDFPTTSGALQTSLGGLDDAFVTKLNSTGTALIYSTFLGGSSDDNGRSIAVDAFGDAYVTGDTSSSDFPTTTGALQSTGGAGYAFVAKLNDKGTGLVYSTYLGGGAEFGIGIALDGSGDAYVVGDTQSSAFPTTPGAVQTSLRGNQDAFVAKLDATGAQLLYGTYLGGTRDNWAMGIAVDPVGNVYASGDTTSSDFPTTPGAVQATFHGGTDTYVAKISITQTTGSLSVTPPQNQNATAGSSASFTLGSFTDSNSAATSWTVDVNWGDNTAHTTFTLSTQGSLGGQAHVYAQSGSNTVTVAVTDNTGASGSGTFQVAISAGSIPGTLTYHGGSLLGNVQIEGMYYGPWNTTSTLQAQKGILDSFFPFITSSTYMDLLAQYSANGITIGHGIFGGDDPNFLAASMTLVTIDGKTYNAISDSQIRTDLSNEIASGGLTAPNANTLYFVFTPPGVVVTFGSENSINNYVAYHDWFHDSPSGKDIIYAVMPYPDGKPNAAYFPLTAIQNLEEAGSHEMSEAITDPKLDGWYNDALGVSGEIGDLCSGDYSTLNGYIVQNEFSNATNASAIANGSNFFIRTLLNPTEGQFSGPIATFVDTSGLGVLSYAAIDWGDGTYESVLTTVQRIDGTTFNLLAKHTYNTDEGTTFNVRVVLTLADDSQAEARGQQNIKDTNGVNHFFTDKGLVTLTDPQVAGTALSFAAQTASAFNGTVATFVDPAGPEPAGNYIITIDWGDGSAPTPGIITLNGTVFTITGSHTYNRAGNFQTTVTIAHEDTQQITIHGNANVASQGNSIVWSGASGLDLNWSDPNNWVGKIVPGPGDIVVFNDKANNRNSTVDPAFVGTVAGLILDSTWGAVLTLQTTLTITGNSTWASGNISAGRFGLVNTGTLTLGGTVNKTLSGLLTNNGTIVHGAGGGLGLQGDATLANNGTYDFQADGTGIFISFGRPHSSIAARSRSPQSPTPTTAPSCT
jgi:hypothetical protein